MSEPQINTRGRVGFVAAWYDFWVGLYWNSAKRRLYILPVPCLGFYIDFASKVKVCAHEPLLELNGKKITGSKRCKHCGLNESYWRAKPMPNLR
jgi:hypothetical protein